MCVSVSVSVSVSVCVCMLHVGPTCVHATANALLSAHLPLRERMQTFRSKQLMSLHAREHALIQATIALGRGAANPASPQVACRGPWAAYLEGQENLAQEKQEWGSVCVNVAKHLRFDTPKHATMRLLLLEFVCYYRNSILT